MKPLLKWAGGKRWLAPYLKEPYRVVNKPRLVEPFAGGLSVSLELGPKTALLNDINPHLINFYRQIKVGSFKILPEHHNDERCYYRCRDEFNEWIVGSDQVETERAAELFYYLNKHGFNGLCRFNSRGMFNVPFGKQESVETISDFSPYSRVFKNWEFSCGDFSELRLLSGDFLYADPPYDDTFTGYSKEDFTWEDQKRLASWCSVHDGPVVVSNSWTERIVELYESSGFKVQKVQAPRSISRNADGRGQVSEILATKKISITIDTGNNYDNYLF